MFPPKAVSGITISTNLLDYGLTVSTQWPQSAITNLQSIYWVGSGSNIVNTNTGNVHVRASLIVTNDTITDNLITKSPWADITAFGAVEGGIVPCDTAFADALNYLSGTGGTIFMPPGNFYLTNVFDMTSVNLSVYLKGSGLRATMLTSAVTNGPAIIGTSMHNFLNHFSDFTLQQAFLSIPSYRAGNYGITCLDGIGYGMDIERVQIRFFGDSGIYLFGPSGPFSIRDCSLQQNAGYGLELENIPQLAQDGYMQGGNIQANFGGMKLNNVVSFHALDVDIEANTIYPAVYITNSSYGNTFTDCSIGISAGSALTPAAAFVIKDSAGIVIEGGTSQVYADSTDNILITGAGSTHNTIIGGCYINSTTTTGYFLNLNGGINTVVLHPFVIVSTYQVGKSIINDSVANYTFATAVKTAARSIPDVNSVSAPAIYCDKIAVGNVYPSLPVEYKANFVESAGVSLSTGETLGFQIAATNSNIVSYNYATDTFLDLTLNPYGHVNIGKGSELRLLGSSSGWVGHRSQTDAGTNIYTWPNSGGTNGNVLMTDGSDNLYWAPIIGLATNAVGLVFLNGDTNAAQTVTTGPGLGITDVGPVHTLSLTAPILWAITGTTNIFNTNSGNVQISHKATIHAINDPTLILTDPTNVFMQIGPNSYIGITDFSTGNWTNADAGTLNIVSSNTIIFRTYSSGDWMTKMWLQNNGDLDLTGNYHGGGVTYGVDPGHVHTAYQPVSVNLTNWSNLPTNYVPIWAQNATNALYAGMATNATWATTATNALYAGLSTNALEANHSTNSDSATYAGTATNALGGWPTIRQVVAGTNIIVVTNPTTFVVSAHAPISFTAEVEDVFTLTDQLIGLQNQTEHYAFMAPLSGGTGLPLFRAIDATDLPAHNQSGTTITSAVAQATHSTNSDSATTAQYVTTAMLTNQVDGARVIGYVDNATHADSADSGWPTEWPWDSITNAPATFPPSAHDQAWATITNAPTIRGLAPGSGITVTTNVNDWVIDATGTTVAIAAGTNITVTTNGSICTVSTHPELNLDDNVSTIFNVNPGQVFTLAPQAAHKVLIGPTGGSAVPTMRLLEASDIPTVTYALYSLYGTAHILGSTNHTDVSFTTLQDGDLIVRSGSSWVNSSNYTGAIKLYSDLRPNTDGGTALGAPDKRFSGIYGQGLDILGDATLLGSTHIGGSNGVTYGVSIDGPVGTAVKADIGTAPQPFGNINCTNLSSTLVQAGSRLVIPVSASAPSTPAEGTLYFDTALAKLRIYIGSGWTNIGP